MVVWVVGIVVVRVGWVAVVVVVIRIQGGSSGGCGVCIVIEFGNPD